MLQMAGMTKPGWSSAPDWAVALNQSIVGEWYWSSEIDVSAYRESRPGLATAC